jgi:hypothetical protein
MCLGLGLWLFIQTVIGTTTSRPVGKHPLTAGCQDGIVPLIKMKGGLTWPKSYVHNLLNRIRTGVGGAEFGPIDSQFVELCGGELSVIRCPFRSKYL